ncbi:MAG: AI-2E family transporter [Patescibacteria group bacterium]
MNSERLSISTGTIWRFLLSIGFLVLVYYLRDLLLLLSVSVVIASAVAPLASFLGRAKIPRVPAVILIYLGTLGAFLSLFPLFLFKVFEDLVRVSVTLPARLSAMPIFTSAREYLSVFIGTVTPEEIMVSLQETLFSFLGALFDSAGVVATVFGGAASLALMVVISFYLAVQQDGVENFIRLAAPIRYETYILELWRRTQRKIGLWMQGQLLLGLIVGVMVYIGLRLVGVEYALMLAILAAVFELIPVIGPILSAVPAVLLAFTISPATGLLTLGIYVVIQQLENHVFYPIVVRKIVGLPSLVVILALLVGAKLAGFLGLVLAVPVATVLMELANDLENRKRHSTSSA